MARTYDESVKYLMEKGRLTEAEAKKRLDGYLKAPAAPASAAQPTPSVNGAAAARPLAPTPSQTDWEQPKTEGPYTGAPITPPGATSDAVLRSREYARAGRVGAQVHPGEYTNVADIRRLDSPRAIQVGKAMGEAAANPRAETMRRPLVEYLMPEERSGASVRAQALGDLKRREADFAQAPERRALAAASSERALAERFAGREDRLQAARREAEGDPSAAIYLNPSPPALAPAAKPSPAVVAGPPRPAPTPAAPPAKPAPVPSDAAYGPGLEKADKYLLSVNPGIDLGRLTPEDRLAAYAERKAASSKE
tara:strand:- start:14026 stop:14952 length:927 start_codon:yes stop_codon:yes gene_type:complete